MGFLSALKAGSNLGKATRVRLGGIGHEPVDSATPSQKCSCRASQDRAAFARKALAWRLL